MLFINKNKNKKGFTLIELLVVIAIIGLLASIVFASLNSSRGAARDAKRRAELRQISNAIELYYSQYSTYVITDPNTNTVTGWSGSGGGWFSLLSPPNYPVSIGQALVNAGFLSSAPHDPGGQDTGRVGGKTGYMYYPCGSGYFIYAGLENPNSNDVNMYAQVGACGGTLDTVYGMNYAIGHR